MLIRVIFAAVVVSASAASADVIHGARPRGGATPRSSTRPAPGKLQRYSGTTPVCYDSKGKPTACAPDFEYFGGPVLSSVKVYAVFWSSEVSPDITASIGGFYQALTNSEVLDWLTEYSTDITVSVGSHQGQAGSQQIIGRGTYAGSYLLPGLSRSYPPCTAGQPLPVCLRDVDVQNELDWQIRHGILPRPDADTLFMVHIPSSLVIRDPGSTSCIDYCSYHSSFSGTYESGVSQYVYYAVVPDHGGACATGCGVGTVFENTCSTASHEILEAITDAAVGSATASDYPLGWYDNASTSQGEIADLCQDDDTVGSDGLTGCGAGDAGCYAVQQVFSKVLWEASAAQQPNVPACVASRYETNDYSIAFRPNTLLLAPGSTAAGIPILTTLTSGTTQPLVLSVASIPAGLHASIDRPTMDVGDGALLTVSADGNAAPFRDGVLVVQAAGSVNHSAALLVQLSAASNDWTLSVTPGTQALFPGTSRTFVVAGLVTLGQAETVTLSPTVSGLPPRVTASFSPSTFTPGASTATLTLTAQADAAPAPLATFAVTGVSTSQPLGHTGSADLLLDTMPTVTFQSPSRGATLFGETTIAISATPGANAQLVSIAIVVDGNATLSSGTSSSVSWDTWTTSNGSHVLQASVLDSDGATTTASLEVIVANAYSDFSMTISPHAVTVPAGGSATFTVVTGVTEGNAEPVTLAITGLPMGVDASFAPGVVTPGGTSTVTLRARSGAAVTPSTTVTLVGTSHSQAAGHAVTASVAVGPAGGRGVGCSSTDAAGPTPGLVFLGLVLLSTRRRAFGSAEMKLHTD